MIRIATGTKTLKQKVVPHKKECEGVPDQLGELDFLFV